MIEFISSWAEQIVLAVIVATIIELILPKNKNKKYIHRRHKFFASEIKYIPTRFCVFLQKA